jgi:hypothetical protein
VKKQWLWFVLLLLVLSSLACAALGGAAATPTTTAVDPPTAVAQVDNVETNPEEAAATAVSSVPGSDAAGSGDILKPGATLDDGSQFVTIKKVSEGLTQLNSYRMELNMRFTPDDETAVQVMEVSVVYVAQPPATSVLMNFAGLEEALDADTISMIQVDGLTYMTVPGFGCFSSPATESEENPFADLANPDQILGEMSNARRVMPDEEINGVAVQHYVFDETSLAEEEANFTTMQGHIYIAKQGNYVVRITVSGEGSGFGEEGKYGQIEMTMDVLDANKPLVVSAPTDCGSDAGSDYPMLADASEVASFAGLLTYKTNTPFDEVVTFYRDELTAEGWTESDDSMLFTGTAFLNFTKAGDSLTVTINEASEGKVVTVVISSQ